MNTNFQKLFILISLVSGLISCSEEEDPLSDDGNVTDYPAITTTFGNSIDLTNLEEYANQSIPDYITKDNTNGNQINDAEATLGRVLFYDKQLSIDNTISCSSCHQQAFAFSDPDAVSTGVNGVTGRHSMRLVNTRFAEEFRFFWDERAATLEEQTTQPIQDHAEMGFSGQDESPDLNDLIEKLEALEYYQELFTFVYGDAEITEARMQNAMAQFIRSIQSFDSKFDIGRAQVNNDRDDFPNFTDEENLGKTLFMQGQDRGGVGCFGCHRAPEFDINPNSRNNGVVAVANDATSLDLENTRSPSLRDLVQADGTLNGPMMHNGEFTSLLQVINHYNQITIDPNNTNLDNRLRNGGTGQNLNLTDNEKNALVAFLKTLSGSDIYTNSKWSDPFH